MATLDRRNRIKQIIKEREIGRQEELVSLLQAEGYKVTQATVSRDIKELKLTKVKGNTIKSKYAIQIDGHIDVSHEKVITLLKAFIINVEYANNLVVVKTLTGNGSSCGMAVDKLKINGVIGSIAGDDTLLIVTHNNKDAEYVTNYINDLVK
ncbi:MAG: arginine repressor [Clostridia bacterium]|nr:arginine repressor [Clostridia bacterium]